MKRAANPSHGQSSPQSEPQDHDAARPSSFETSESAPERPQNASDLGAGGFVTRPVPPRGRPPIDDNGNRMRWSGRDESYTASAGDLRAMSRLATSRAGSAHYGRVKTSWLVDFSVARCAIRTSGLNYRPVQFSSRRRSAVPWMCSLLPPLLQTLRPLVVHRVRRQKQGLQDHQEASAPTSQPTTPPYAGELPTNPEDAVRARRVQSPTAYEVVVRGLSSCNNAPSVASHADHGEACYSVELS